MGVTARLTIELGSSCSASKWDAELHELRGDLPHRSAPQPTAEE